MIPFLKHSLSSFMDNVHAEITLSVQVTNQLASCEAQGLDSGLALQAIEAAKADTERPSFIKVSTIIGYGSPNKADSHDAHGAALGDKEREATSANLQWNFPPFEYPKVRAVTVLVCAANLLLFPCRAQVGPV